MLSSNRFRSGTILIVLAGLVSAILALYAYLTPLSGVTGTFGPLIVIGAALLIAVAALVMPKEGGRGWRITLGVLILLGLLGTAFAGVLLHRWFIPIALAVGLIGLILEMMADTSTARKG